MTEFWTVQQAQAQAELLAKEFSNRQILIFGNGVPNLNVPIGVEYEDRSTQPPIRYRKIGQGPNDWMKLLNAETASETEVLQGTNEEKIVTPARLTEKLNQFGADVLGIPNTVSDNVPTTHHAELIYIADSSTYLLELPVDLPLSMGSVRLSANQNNVELSNISGAAIGQMVNLKRASDFTILLNGSEQIKLSEPFHFSDLEKLDNITLQKITSSTWVEVCRKKF